MTDLERRALLGDRQAQEECTRQGIMLACPMCGKSVRVTGPEDWKPTFYDPDSGGDPYAFECECGFAFGTNCYDFKQALALYNTRSAPPIGRCKDCANWRGEQGDTDAPCRDCDGVMEADNFCKNFEPKMPYLPSKATFPETHALQRFHDGEIKDHFASMEIIGEVSADEVAEWFKLHKKGHPDAT